MTEIATIIVLISVIRLSSYGAWNLREKNNVLGSVGVGILVIAIIFLFYTVIINLDF